MQVYDGFGTQAVENVRVVLAQTGDVCMTDGDGNAVFLISPWKEPDTHLPKRLAIKGQDVTLLLYHEAYVDTVVLHVLLDGTQKNVLSVEMFQKNDLPNEQVVVSSQMPDRAWIESVLEYFR